MKDKTNFESTERERIFYIRFEDTPGGLEGAGGGRVGVKYGGVKDVTG